MPIFDETDVLNGLCGSVGEMTSEQQVIPWLNHPR
jgi:hypothetical protein